jgi:hypothetical protein
MEPFSQSVATLMSCATSGASISRAAQQHLTNCCSPSGHVTLLLGDRERRWSLHFTWHSSQRRKVKFCSSVQPQPSRPFMTSCFAAGRAVLNIGGIANFTFLPARGAPPTSPHPARYAPFGQSTLLSQMTQFFRANLSALTPDPAMC